MSNSYEFLIQGITKAFELIINQDPYVMSITALSIKVSIIAVSFAILTSIPLAFFLAFFDFKGKNSIITLINTGMGLPPVFVGLFIFVLLVPSGIFGALNKIYTPEAMIIAQYILVTPIITGISLAAIKAVPTSIIETVYTLGGNKKDAIIVSFFEAKYGIITASLAGLGRAFSEVGAILIVGGNIAYSGSLGGIGDGLSYTRTLTTAITSETSKGDISTAIALGIILIFLNLSVNMIVSFFQKRN